MTKRTTYCLILFILILAACNPGDLEPGSGLTVPTTREPAATATESTNLSNIPIETVNAEFTRDAAASPTPTPWDVPSVTPPLTVPATDGPPPSPTPASPFPGFRYVTEAGIWQVDANGQPELITTRQDVKLSEDGSQALYVEEGDIWLFNFPVTETQNLTESSGRHHCCATWWPERPDTIIFGSWPSADDSGPSSGYLSVVQTDGSGYAVLSEGEANALPAGSPDGQQIAYDRGGSAWIYDYSTGTSTQLNLADYGVENVQRIAGPSWSPDGTRIAWTIAATNPDWRISVMVIDLVSNTAELYHTYENIGRGGWFPGPLWHPNGDWLAFVAEDVNPENFGVWVVNTSTGEEAYIGRGQNPIWSPDGRWLTYSEFGSSDGTEPANWLAQVDSWSHVNLEIPDDGRLLDWVSPG
jgi:Tol biopolymer transport system component